MRDDYLVFGAPDIHEEEINEVVNSLRSGWIGTGPKVHAFEKHFSTYIGSPYAIAVNSGTAALHLSQIAAGISEGDEVITTPLTFCATANAIVHSKATPVFADIDKETMNIDPAAIKKAITAKTKAILPVHFAGRPCNMDAIMAIAKEHNLIVIEDAAHAIEAEYKNKKIGTIGDFSCFSFYVTKNLCTAEGGMITTSNEIAMHQIKRLALHGMSEDAWKRFADDGFKHYQVIYSGFKYNMTDIQASLGIHQLNRIEKNWHRRKEIWDRYNDAFKDLPLVIPSKTEPNCKHAYHLYTILIDIENVKCSRDEFVHKLHKQNIGTGIHYLSLNLHEFYQKAFGYKEGDFPNAEWISKRTVSLPLSSKLTDKDVDDVIETVKNNLS